MDPVQKAVINHTFGVPLIKTKRPVISCNVCQIRFNSEVQEHKNKTVLLSLHLSRLRSPRGDKHALSCCLYTFTFHLVHIFLRNVLEGFPSCFLSP